ncbi:MAG: Rv3654c family TadE-like protein [Microbacteriaceae bacterium]
MRDDVGSGSVLVVALVVATVAVALAVLALSAGLSVRQRLIGTADAAALAAADGASGAVPGAPCELARRVAAATGARLQSCRIDGLVASVEVAGAFGAVPISARSRAGPPP